MTTMPFRFALGALLAGGFLFGPAAQAQLLNSNFSNGIDHWELFGSSTIIPNIFDRPQPPPGLIPSSAGVVLPFGETLVIATDRRFPGGTQDGLVATGLSRKFSLRAPSRLPGRLGNGVGRLRFSNYGGIRQQANLTFDLRFLSYEAAGSAFDFGGATLNGQPIVAVDGRGGLGAPPSRAQPLFGFTNSTETIHFQKDLTSLLGTDPTLSFFVADTADAIVQSGLAIDNLKLTLVYVVEDYDAIWSAQNSGLPMALAQRQSLLNVAFNVNRDLNAHLFHLRSALMDAGAAGPDGKESKEVKDILPPEKRWSFFASGNYGYRDVDTISRTAGFDSDLFTATAGVEYQLTPQLTIGVAGTRVEADNDIGGLGSADIEGYSFAAYGSVFVQNFYADLVYAIGTYDHEINRNTGLGQTASARPSSLTNSLQFNTGYNIPVGRLVTGPLLSLDWVHGDIDGYSEQRGGNANMTVPDQDVDSLVTQLGWQLSLPTKTTFGAVTPQIRASWVHEFLNDDQSVTAGLSTSPYYLINGTKASRIGSFETSAGAGNPGADYLSVGAGVAVQFGDRAAVILDYETRFFQDDSSAQSVSLTGQIKF